MRQVEVSRTLVFDAPRHARSFFEALLVDNLDVGRPEEMQVIFGRRLGTPPAGGYRSRLLRTGQPRRRPRVEGLLRASERRRYHCPRQRCTGDYAVRWETLTAAFRAAAVRPAKPDRVIRLPGDLGG